MMFSKFIDIAFESTLHFLFLPEDVGVGSGLGNHPRIGIDAGGFQQSLETLTLHEFAKPYAVLAFFHPPIPDVLDNLFDFIIRLFRFDEWNQHGTHLGTI